MSLNDSCHRALRLALAVFIVAAAPLLRLAPAPAAATIDCTPLKPPGKEFMLDAGGKLKASANALTKSLADAKGEAEASVRLAIRDALQGYPNKDVLYLSKMVLYLACENMRVAPQLSPEQRNSMLYTMTQQLTALYTPKSVTSLCKEAYESSLPKNVAFLDEKRASDLVRRFSEMAAPVPSARGAPSTPLNAQREMAVAYFKGKWVEPCGWIVTTDVARKNPVDPRGWMIVGSTDDSVNLTVMTRQDSSSLRKGQKIEVVGRLVDVQAQGFSRANAPGNQSSANSVYLDSAVWREKQ